MTHFILFFGGIFLVFQGLADAEYFIALLGALVSFNSAELVYELLTGKNFGLGRKPAESLEELRNRDKHELQHNTDT